MLRVLQYIENQSPLDCSTFEMLVEQIAVVTGLSFNQARVAFLRLTVYNAASIRPNENHIMCVSEGDVCVVFVNARSALATRKHK